MIYFLSKKKLLFKLSEEITEISTVEEVFSKLSNENELCLDTETTGINPHEDVIIMLQLGTVSGDQYVIDTRDFPVEVFKELIESKDLIIGHNLKFDYNMLKRYRILLNNIYDTMLADQVIHNGKYGMQDIIKNKRYSLAGVYRFYFKKNIDKEVRDEFHTINDSAFTLRQVTYGANDVKYPLLIRKKQLKEINQWELEKCVSLENKVSLALADIEYNGFHLDKEKWKNITKVYKERLTNTTKELDNMLLNSGTKALKYKKVGFQLDLFSGQISDDRTTIVNWSSDQQVYDILSNVFNIFPVDKHGKASSSAKAIELMIEKHPLLDLILKYREEDKVISSFGESFIKKYLDDENRLHTTFNQIIETGRVSSRKPNLQQIPNDILFRQAFTAPEGKMLSTADYSSQEGRIMADKAEDLNYINFFLNGDGDIHSFVASTMFSAAFGRPFHVSQTENKEYRQKGKILNFFISFGGSAYTLSKTLKIESVEAQQLINAFYQGFPKLKEMFEKDKSFALKNGYIRTNNITNRIRHFPTFPDYQRLIKKDYWNLSTEDLSKLGSIKGAIERRAQNSPIQGTAGDITKTALILLREELLKCNIKPFKEASVKMVNVIHDELVIESDTSIIDFWAQKQKECMEKAASFYLKYIPIPAKPVIQSHWTH